MTAKMLEALFTFGLLLAAFAVTKAEAVVSSRGWRPSIGLVPFKPFLADVVDEAPTAVAAAVASDSCALYKVTFNQELYFQYVQYKVTLPDMLQFTLCMWMRFHNHTNDHPVFSYAVPDQPRAIVSWISNTARSSYLSMTVAGHTFYRLNYPFRLHRWYHMCQSWNGKTGEWQAWVNAERVGRGFHNRLVGYTVPGGGVALSGQEQSQLGGGFLEGLGAPKGSGGMLGEITLLHMYAASLAPGKAHRDHKHHHGNHYETNPANGQSPNAQRQPSTPAPVPQFPSPFLVNGQLAPTGLHVAAQLAGLVRQPGEANLDTAALHQTFPGAPAAGTTSPIFPSDLVQHQLFKRNHAGDTDKIKGDNEAAVAENKEEKSESPGSKSKRQIVSQALLDDVTGLGLGLVPDYNPLSVPEDVLLASKAKAPVDDYPREPAEGEVIQVMNVCSGCAREPFKKVELISWRTTPKKLYSGALYSQATPQCRKF